MSDAELNPEEAPAAEDQPAESPGEWGKWFSRRALTHAPPPHTHTALCEWRGASIVKQRFGVCLVCVLAEEPPVPTAEAGQTDVGAPPAEEEAAPPAVEADEAPPQNQNQNQNQSPLHRRGAVRRSRQRPLSPRPPRRRRLLLPMMPQKPPPRSRPPTRPLLPKKPLSLLMASPGTARHRQPGTSPRIPHRRRKRRQSQRH